MTRAAAAVWGPFFGVFFVLLIGLEIAGVLGAPWGTLTNTVRTFVHTYWWAHLVLAFLFAIGYLHFFGDWP